MLWNEIYINIGRQTTCLDFHKQIMRRHKFTEQIMIGREGRKNMEFSFEIQI